ncbi:hypothetical protein [Streptomyces sp. NPDC048496]|uniref:hypothetical protein n=1 Tax=Streptomyces sp. NPDC048496 TaxID=3365558 RepID=UPI003723ADD6
MRSVVQCEPPFTEELRVDHHPGRVVVRAGNGGVHADQARSTSPRAAASAINASMRP